jgi:hypothetical protein
MFSEDEYKAAIDRLRILSREPLGTPQTEGMQTLIDAILDYEARHGLERTVSKKKPPRDPAI